MLVKKAEILSNPEAIFSYDRMCTNDKNIFLKQFRDQMLSDSDQSFTSYINETQKHF